MNIKYLTENGEYKSLETDQIEIELDNGNCLEIFEESSGVLRVENVTKTVRKSEEYGIMITSQNYSTVHIIPEG